MNNTDKLKMGLFVLFWVAVTVGVPAYITLNGPVIIIDCIGDCL